MCDNCGRKTHISEECAEKLTHEELLKRYFLIEEALAIASEVDDERVALIKHIGQIIMANLHKTPNAN